MTEKEILKALKSETRRVERIKEDIESAKADLKATQKAVKFWESELEKVRKSKKKT